MAEQGQYLSIATDLVKRWEITAGNTESEIIYVSSQAKFINSLSIDTSITIPGNSDNLILQFDKNSAPDETLTRVKIEPLTGVTGERINFQITIPRAAADTDISGNYEIMQTGMRFHQIRIISSITIPADTTLGGYLNFVN